MIFEDHSKPDMTDIAECLKQASRAEAILESLLSAYEAGTAILPDDVSSALLGHFYEDT